MHFTPCKRKNKYEKNSSVTRKQYKTLKQMLEGFQAQYILILSENSESEWRISLWKVQVLFLPESFMELNTTINYLSIKHILYSNHPIVTSTRCSNWFVNKWSTIYTWIEITKQQLIKRQVKVTLSDIVLQTIYQKGFSNMQV